MPTCTRCGQENPESATFCNSCGTALAVATATDEERRVVSVVFVDLVGFTQRSEQLDPEDVRAFLTPYYERVRSELERFGGRVEKFIGDAVMGVFGAPTAFGDDHERAVRAALAVRDWAGEDGLQVRIAVNTGEAIVDVGARPEHGQAMIAGDVVNTAARLQSAAPVGSVLVGQETHASTRTSIEYQPGFEPVRAKGKAEPVQAWIALRAVAAAGERLLTPVPLIGRERELGVLAGIWDRVAEERRPHLVTVFGPAGIGKSRLALELMDHVGARDGRVLRGRSMPYGASTPYGAFAQLVKQVAKVYDSDELPEARSKLSTALADLLWVEEADEHARNLSVLIGLDEGEVPDRETLFFSARLFVESLGSQVPTLLLFEDIHWADASLLELIEMLAARVREVPVLLLALARPEMLTERPGWAGGLPAYTALPLDRLTESASLELAGLLLERLDASGRPVVESIAETAEGNPLFIEELAASVAERSTLDADHLPTSVRAIVAARLDALPPDERSLLVDASVVGRIFWRGAVTRMSSRPDLSALLGSLEARDFVRREAVSRISGDQQYAFKHAVIRDVAYQRLPRAARRDRHAAVAGFLEETTGEIGQSAEALAYHWREAGDAERAVTHLVAAADQAGRGWAKGHAFELYREAVALVPSEDGELRRNLQRKMAVAMQALHHVHDAERLRPSEG